MSESAKRRCTSSEWLAAQHARGTKLPKDEVERLYSEGLTQAEIGCIFGVSQKVVHRFMKNNGIAARKAAKRNQNGPDNSYWKGGKVLDEAGYVRVQCKGHARASKSGGYVREHILVAEKVLGRPIERGEHVHHINGNKSDNRPENLAVMSASEHIALHGKLRKNCNGKGAARWASEIEEFPMAVTKLRFGED